MSQYAEARKRMADAAETAEDRPSLRCTAQGCPMAPAFSDGGKTCWCAYHRACHANDLARVTSVLNEHKDLRDIVNEGRRLHAEHGNEEAWPAEWKRMRNLLLFAGYDDPGPDAPTFHGWLYRVETLLGSLVANAMGVRRRAA